MNCHVYKSQRKADTYLFVPERDRFDAVPAELLATLGRLDHVMTLELTPQRRLARASATEVMAALHDRGYHLQFPPSQGDAPDPSSAPAN